MTAEQARARMIVGLPLAERRPVLAGVSTAVLEGGSGPPLILLHGGIECGGAMWAPVIPGLARRHRLIVPDAPGLGASQPVDRLDAAVFDAWFSDVLGLAGDQRPIVVAHSLFGSMAARFAARRGDLLARLVIYAAPAVGPYRMPLGLKVAAIRFGLRPTPRNAERFDRFALRDLDATQARDPEWYAAFASYCIAQAKVRHVSQTMWQLIKTETKQLPEPQLRGITVPTGLLWGRHDRMVPLAIGEFAHASFGWPLHVIDDVAHAPHIERPAAFVTALTEICSNRDVQAAGNADQR